MGFVVPFGGLVVLLMIGFLVLQASAAAVDRPRKVDDEIREAIRQTQFYAEALAAAKAESLSKFESVWKSSPIDSTPSPSLMIDFLAGRHRRGVITRSSRSGRRARRSSFGRRSGL